MALPQPIGKGYVGGVSVCVTIGCDEGARVRMS